MACIDSKEVECEQDILKAIIDGSRLSPQGTDGILHWLDIHCLGKEEGEDMYIRGNSWENRDPPGFLR